MRTLNLDLLFFIQWLRFIPHLTTPIRKQFSWINKLNQKNQTPSRDFRKQRRETIQQKIGNKLLKGNKLKKQKGKSNWAKDWKHSYLQSLILLAAVSLSSIPRSESQPFLSCCSLSLFLGSIRRPPLSLPVADAPHLPFGLLLALSRWRTPPAIRFAAAARQRNRRQTSPGRTSLVTLSLSLLNLFLELHNYTVCFSRINFYVIAGIYSRVWFCFSIFLVITELVVHEARVAGINFYVIAGIA